MAVTKIHAITATVDKAVAYICTPDKTDGSIYISSYACAPETAAIDFKYTLDHCRENSPNKAYHLIQAFAPGEVSFDEAHQIGKELADKVLEGKYSYVVTTHIDKGHVHNHIIFCATDNIEHDKYHDCKQCCPQLHKTGSYTHCPQCQLRRNPTHSFLLYYINLKKFLQARPYSCNIIYKSAKK